MAEREQSAATSTGEPPKAGTCSRCGGQLYVGLTHGCTTGARIPSVASVRLCDNCHEREGTMRWGDALAMTHGFVQMWCEVCVLTKQIEHAEERAALLPELRARLEALRV